MQVVYLFFGFLFINFVESDNYIYHLNESEYEKMPPMFHLDPYEECLQEEGGMFCNVNFQLVSDQPTPLYDMITQFSAHKWTHYNHSLPEYGICLTRTCKHLYKQNTRADPSVILEACLNQSLWTKYELKAKVPPNVKCDRANVKIEWDRLDIAVSIVLVSILLFNLVGSLQESYNLDVNKKVTRFLDCFSIKRNWMKLTLPAGEGPEPRLTRLVGFNGARMVLTILIITGHTVMPFVNHVENTQFVEETFYNRFFAMLQNGSLLIQCFLTISGFLLSYNVMLYKEKHKITWHLLPVGIAKRLLRFLPVYALVLAVTATLMRHTKSGPLWQSLMGNDIEECRRTWWLHLLFINNYVPLSHSSHCMIHSWYLAADTQLYIVGLCVCILVKERHRMKVLAGLIITGMVTTFAHTYFQDLDANLLFALESTRTYFTHDGTYNYVYKRSYNNLPSYCIGLGFGFLLYHWQKTNYQFHKFVSHPYLQWVTVMAYMAGLHVNTLFYSDRPPAPVYLRALHASIIKPVFSLISCVLILGMVFKFDNILRGIVEAKIWTVPARVSYSIYVIHMAVFRLAAATKSTLFYARHLYFWSMVMMTLSVSFLAAILLHLLVDMPCQNIIKLSTENPEHKKSLTEHVEKTEKKSVANIKED